MDTQNPETPQTEKPPEPADTPGSPEVPKEEQAPSSSDQAPPVEEPIILSKLFPNAEQDLDSLFPDPGMKKLLKDVVRLRQRNERFLKSLKTGGGPEDEGEPEEPA